jgi:hypothetical protein
MNLKVFLFMFVSIPLIYSNDVIQSVKTKIISQSRFEAPMDIHLIESLTNVQSLIMCGALCDRHIICRTADYNPTNKICRLFETVSSAGTFLTDPTTSIVALNYCTNDEQTEPEYVCTRSGTFTIQQILDQLSLSTTMTLSSDRGVYANMYGVYTSSYAGYLSFFIYTGAKTTLDHSPTEITNINSAPSNGLVAVRYYDKIGVLYNNIGTPSAPEFIPIVNISLSDSPYSCVTTSNYIYITYANSHIIMTIYDLSTGLIISTISNNNSLTYRPVITHWNDTMIVIDEYQVTEYTLTGVYQGNWAYFSGYQYGARHYIHHDYAGRRYTCNDSGSNRGIYVFLLNGTQIGQGPTACSRAFQVYLTKEQAMFITTPTTGTYMQIINF